MSAADECDWPDIPNRAIDWDAVICRRRSEFLRITLLRVGVLACGELPSYSDVADLSLVLQDLHPFAGQELIYLRRRDFFVLRALMDETIARMYGYERVKPRI